MQYDCDVVGEIDFGEGPVRIRCTQIGSHETHICNVRIPPREISPEHPSISHRRNVFEVNESD